MVGRPQVPLTPPSFPPRPKAQSPKKAHVLVAPVRASRGEASTPRQGRRRHRATGARGAPKPPSGPRLARSNGILTKHRRSRRFSPLTYGVSQRNTGELEIIRWTESREPQQEMGKDRTELRARRLHEPRLYSNPNQWEYLGDECVRSRAVVWLGRLHADPGAADSGVTGKRHWAMPPCNTGLSSL